MRGFFGFINHVTCHSSKVTSLCLSHSKRSNLLQ